LLTFRHGAVTEHSPRREGSRPTEVKAPRVIPFRCLLSTRLGGPHNQSGRGSENKMLAVSENRTEIFQRRDTIPVSWKRVSCL